MRKNISLTIVLALLFALVLPAATCLADDEEEADFTYFRGIVQRVDRASESPLEEAGYESEAFYVDVLITNGPYKGQVKTVYHVTSGNQAYDILVKPGDKVVLQAVEGLGDLVEIYITGYVRDTYLYWAVGLFIVIVLLLGGRAGLKSLLGLGLTAVLIVKIYLPLLLQGKDPVFMAIAISAAAVVLTMFIVAGVSRKTMAAILGTVGGVVVAGLLSVIFGRLSRLTGLSNHETQMLLYIPQGVDFNYQGLLFGGIVIGAMGAVMDVGMSIASSLFEMKQLRPDLGPWQLFRSGMNIGRDIMGTMTNTLILAYAGGSTSLLLLFQAYNMPLVEIMNMDLIATEVVRSLAGSIGLVSAIPLTAAAAAWLTRRSVASAGKSAATEVSANTPADV